MKYLLIFILFCSFAGPGDPPEVGISFNSFWKSKSVAIAGYTKINARYEWVAGAFDSGLHVPQYNGVPSGLRSGVWTADGAVAVDTSNHRLYFYSGGSWRYSTSGTGGGTPTLQQVLTAGSTLTTDHIIDPDGNDFEIDNFTYGEMQSNGGSQGHGIFINDSTIIGSGNVARSRFIVKDSSIIARPFLGNFYIDTLNYTLSTTGKKIMLRDTATGLVQNIDPSLMVKLAGATLQQDTITLASFGGGARFQSDTAVFTDSTLYGAFYNDGSDTLIITKIWAVMSGGTSDTLGVQLYYNDSLNVIGSTIATSTLPVSSTTTGNSTSTLTNQKIPPGNWVWCKSPTVVTGRKPYFLSVSMIGYKSRRL